MKSTTGNVMIEQMTETPVTEYMKIRRYVLNLILRANGQSIRIPSIVELSNTFGVSRPTVSKAMKALTDDGLVVGRPGIGTFTNPAKLPPAVLGGGPKPKVVGLLLGDGMSTFMSAYQTRYLAAVMEELSNLGVYVQLFNLTSHAPEVMVREIELGMFDVLLWCFMNPPKVLTALRAAGQRVITTEVDADLPQNARLDAEGLGYRCGKLLLAEGRKNVVYFTATGPWQPPLRGLRRAFAEAGVEPNPNYFFSDPSTAMDDLRKLLAFRAPVDAVFNYAFEGGEVMKLLLEAGVDIKKGCRVIQRVAADDAYDYCGYTYEPPFVAHARQVAELAAAALGDESSAAAESGGDRRLAEYALKFLERGGGATLRLEEMETALPAGIEVLE